MGAPGWASFFFLRVLGTYVVRGEVRGKIRSEVRVEVRGEVRVEVKEWGTW